MKRVIKFAVFFLIAVFVSTACQKNFEAITSPVVLTNKPPIAIAGIDQTIVLPKDSVTLNGSASIDPDGTIISYIWIKISGPAQSNIMKPDSSITVVKALVTGVYLFELTITDNGGLSAKDTIQVNVIITSCAVNRPVINARLIPVGTLSLNRIEMIAATAGTKIVFADGVFGSNASSNMSTRVDIYDFVTNTMSTTELSVLRQGMTAASVGNKIFFAGGFNDEGYTRVDIYDVSTGIWSTAELSEGRGNMASATIGDKIFFAGGELYRGNTHHLSNRVDIYDNTTNSWSTASLSEGRKYLSATVAGNKIYFAGGYGPTDTDISSRIDIYDAATNSWSISRLNEGKVHFGSIAVGNKIYWAGGRTPPIGSPSSQVEIRDINTQVSILTCLSQEKAWFGTALKGNDIVFFTGTSGPLNFDIYNTTSNTWSIGTLNQSINSCAVISANNKIYVAGGRVGNGSVFSNQVWLLEW